MRPTPVAACAALLLGLLAAAALRAQVPEPFLRPVSSGEVRFATASHTLPEGVDILLRPLADSLLARPGRRLKISAHTDAVGSAAYNQVLARRRAAAVAEWFAAAGVPREALGTEGYGELRPTASNTTDEGRERNRRALVEVLDLVPATRLEGVLRDDSTGLAVAGQVFARGRDFTDSTRTDSAGHFALRVPAGEVVALDVFAKGFFLETRMVKATPEKRTLLAIPLKPARPGLRADVPDLYFIGNQDTLLPVSRSVLPRLLRFMEINNDITVEIAGHVNQPGLTKVTVDSWEFGLSERRAARIHDYLVEHGVNPARLRRKGYGNWEMRFPFPKSPKEESANRRVEIRVLE